MVTNYKNIIILTLLVAIMVLMAVWWDFRLVLLFISNIFFYGKSEAKLFFFVTYLTLFYFLTNAFKPTWVSKVKDSWLWGLVFILALLNFASYLYFVFSFNLNIREMPIFVSNGYFESLSQPVHIHTLKAAITWPLYVLGYKALPTYGDGLMFFPYIPIFYISAFFVLLVLLLVVFFKGFQFISDSTGLFLSTLVYSLLSFGLLKSLLDGGPLDYEFILYFLFFYQLLKRKIFFVLSLFVWVITLVLHFFYYRFYLKVEDVSLIFDVLFPFVYLFCLLMFFTLLVVERRLSAKAVFFGLLGLGLQFKNPTLIDLNYSNTKIPNSSLVVISSHKDLPYETLYKGSTISSYVDVAKKESTLMDYIKRHNLRFQYYPILIDGLTCDMKATTIYWSEVKVVSGFPKLGEKFGHSYDYFSYSKMLKDGNDYVLEYHSKGCTPPYQQLLAQEVFDRGVERGIIFSKEEVRVR